MRWAVIPQAHHGLCVADIDAARAALAAVGFTEIQPNAPQPLVYADTPEDEVGRLTCPDLGSPYRTHFVEHPGTHHQIDLIEIDASAIVDRPSDRPLSGDLTVVMPLPGGDVGAATEALRPWFGDRLRVTDDGDPWATLHVATSEWPAVESFLTEVLGVGLDPLGHNRWRMTGIGGRIDVAADDDTVLPDPAIGKRYSGANHLRLLHRDTAAIDKALTDRADARWILPPNGGFAFVAGPSNLTIEMFDRSVT
ncbi:MAG: hypothetical protein ACR2HP_18565 [Ilumatobacteraceae bacterium]